MPTTPSTAVKKPRKQAPAKTKVAEPLPAEPTIASPSANNEYVVIDSKILLLSLAIVVAGIAIALGLYFGLSGNKKTVAAAANGVTPTTTPTTTGTSPTSFTAASTSIGTSPYLGDKTKAKVAIVEFSDFECPYCYRHFTQVHPSLVSDYVNTGKAILVFRNNPLSFHEPAASQEALASLCVQNEKNNTAYFQFHDLLFTNTKQNGQGLPSGSLHTYAVQVGADGAKFDQCLASAQYQSTITADESAASSAGLTGTPGFVVGKLNSDGTVTGVAIPGAYPLSSFQQVISQYL